MKKYLINGAMALIVGGFIVSCSHDDISQPATVDQMTKSFDEMFTELYGPIAPNHNWGFETVLAETGEEEATEETTEEATEEKASTRSAERAATRATVDIASDKISSDFPTKHYQSEYKTIFNNLTNSGKSFEFESSGSFTFSVIYAHTSANEEVGCYYYNPNSQVPTGENKVRCIGDIQDKNKGIGKYVQVTESIIPSWTSWMGLGWKPFNPQDNGEAEWYSSFSNILPYQGAIAQTFTIDGVDVPAGYRVGFYIKNGNNVLYTNASLNSTGSKPATYSGKYIGFEDNTGTTDHHDVIIEVISGGTVKEIAKKASYEETTTTETRQFKQIIDLGRVFVEDIATASLRNVDDIDYNDIVFDARVWRIWNQIDTKVNGKITKTIKETNVKYQYDINLLATGGTIEEKVNGVDVHNKFGVGQAFMVNTWTPNCTEKLSGQWNTPNNTLGPIDFSYERTNVTTGEDIGIGSIPIVLKYKNEILDISGKKDIEGVGSAPFKLCLPVGTLWPIERVNIVDAYPGFKDYVNKNAGFSTDGQVGTNLYPAPTSTIQAEMAPAKGYIKNWTNYPDNGELIKSDPFKYTVVWAGEVSTNSTPIILYNYEFAANKTLRFYGSGTISVLCGSGSTTELVSGSMAAGYLEVKISNAQASLLSQGILINGSNFKLTKIIVF